ncbi:lipid transferase CIDEB-like [Narcine bancroftii]|uniref:lipid transferase CIDEB-like n=1 Tax=Narcine bancroftii TaxID=1343680 RepID=UPI003831A938
MDSPKTQDYVTTASSLVRSITAASTEMTRRLWSSSPHRRPFRLCNHDRSQRHGVTAGTLGELINKALDVLLISELATLVLEEDGTVIDSEDVFEHLEDDRVLMALEKGQRWRPPKRGMISYTLTQKPKDSKDIARITFDIYKLNPRDLFGSLNIRATFYDFYSMTFEVKCLGPKKIIRQVLRVASSLMSAIGQLLLAASSFTRRLVEGTERLVEFDD